MDISQIIEMGAGLFQNSEQSGEEGSALDIGTITSAISGLFGGDDNGEGLDLSSIISSLSGGSLASIAQSWLGDGDNEAVSSSQIAEIFGQDKISEFASKLNMSEDQAAGGLADAIPAMIDKASNAGSLLDSVGGISGALGMVGKLFGR